MNITNLSQVARDISCLVLSCTVYPCVCVTSWKQISITKFCHICVLTFPGSEFWCDKVWNVLCAGWLIVLNSNYEEVSCEIWKVHGPRTVIFQKISWLYSSGKFDTFISRQCQFITDIMDTGFSCQGICSMHKS